MNYLQILLLQFYGSNDGDYLTIYDIQSDGNPKLISNLTGSDTIDHLSKREGLCSTKWPRIVH